MSISGSVLPSWLYSLLRGRVPAATVLTSLVSTFVLAFKFQILILHFYVPPQASYLILHKCEPELFFAVSWLVLLVPPSVVAWICRGSISRAHRLPPQYQSSPFIGSPARIHHPLSRVSVSPSPKMNQPLELFPTSSLRSPLKIPLENAPTQLCF